MDWYHNVLLYIGLFDAAIIMFGGLVAAFVVIMGWDAEKLWERVFPATSILIGSNIAAAIVLTATHWLLY